MTYTIVKTFIDVDPNNPFPLGRHVEHDSRSLAYRIDVSGITISSVKHARRIGLLDQKQVGGCTGWSETGLLGTDPFFATVSGIPGCTLDNAMGLKLYEKATQVDDIQGSYPPDDTGSTGTAAAKAAQSYGYIGGYQHGFSINDLLGALQLQPVLIGSNWYDSMFNPDSSGQITISPNAQVAGGHEYACVGYDQPSDELLFAQTWGDWGPLHGFFTMKTSMMVRLLGEQGDVTIPTLISAPAPTPTPPAPNPPAPGTRVTDAALKTSHDRDPIPTFEKNFAIWRTTH